MATTVACRISTSFIKLSCTSPCFLTFSWITRSVLLMTGWVEFLAVLAERFVRTSARDAFHDGFRALAVAVALFGAPSTDPGLGALVSLVVGDLLAVVALLRAFPALKDLGVSRLSSCGEKS